MPRLNRAQTPRPRFAHPVLSLVVAAVAAVAAIAQCGLLLDSAAAGRASATPALSSNRAEAVPARKQRVGAAPTAAVARDTARPN